MEVEREGEAVVEADRLSAIVRESAEDVLVFDVEGTTCQIRGADSRFTIYGQDPKQYPTVRTLAEGEADLLMSLEQLQLGIQQSLFATAKESSRYAINGVLWEVKGKKLHVRRHGRQTAWHAAGWTSKKPPAKDMAERKMIVPAKTMALLEKIGSHDKESVAVKLIENQVLIKYANVVVSSNLVEGNFPKYEDIIPGDYDKKLSLSTEAVFSAVRRAALLTSEESKGIKLSVGKDALVFSGQLAGGGCGGGQHAHRV